MAEGTDVVPDAVREFGWAAQQAGLRASEPMGTSLGELSGATLGMSRIPEATEAAARYQQMGQSVSLFLTDLGYGVSALANTAALVAWNYEQGDDTQQEQMASVDAAFHPPAGTTSIQSQVAEQAATDAAEQQRLARLSRMMGEPADGSVTTASGLVLTGEQARAVLESQAEGNGTTTEASNVGEMSATERMTYVNSTINAHHEEMRLASATRQVVRWSEDGQPLEYGMVAPDSYIEASGASEENTSTQGDYAAAQEWAEQEREDGFEATVTVDDDGEVHKDSTRYDAGYTTSYGTTTTTTTYSPYPATGGSS